MVLEGEIGRSVHGDRAGEQVREAAGEQQRFLSAHRTADGVQPAAIDVKPGELRLDDVGHSREVGDLAAVAPRVQRQEAPVTVGIDDGEVSERRESAPAAGVDLPVDGAAVRRDDEGDGGVVARPVVVGEQDVRVAPVPVVGPVRDRDLPRCERLGVVGVRRDGG